MMSHRSSAFGESRAARPSHLGLGAVIGRITSQTRVKDTLMDVRGSYDSAASAYTEQLASELARKPLDRHLLNRFAEQTRGRGLVADIGCGPGQVARYLHDQGVTVVGIDLSAEMINCATRLNPGLDFRVGDMRQLSLPDASLAGLVAFYSIVHFDSAELAGVMLQLRRVLVPGGLALVAFHVGEQVVHVEELFGAPVDLDFRYHVPGSVIEAMKSAQFAVIEQAEREPYEGAEHQSRRCYLLARAV
jgi:SAM-dependent methyltransferase